MGYWLFGRGDLCKAQIYLNINYNKRYNESGFTGVCFENT